MAAIDVPAPPVVLLGAPAAAEEDPGRRLFGGPSRDDCWLRSAAPPRAAGAEGGPVGEAEASAGLSAILAARRAALSSLADFLSFPPPSLAGLACWCCGFAFAVSAVDALAPAEEPGLEVAEEALAVGSDMVSLVGDSIRVLDRGRSEKVLDKERCDSRKSWNALHFSEPDEKSKIREMLGCLFATNLFPFSVCH